MSLSPDDKSLLPWASLPASLAHLLRPSLPEAVAAVVDAIATAVPDYRVELPGAFGAALHRGVEIALTRQLDLIGTDEPALDQRARDVYRRVGAGESAAGRSLESLLAAYRTGARAAWHNLAGAATAAGVGAVDLVALAEAVFVYIDELSAASVDGYTAQQAATLGYLDARRARLAQALLDGALGREPERVLAMADEAAWPVPRRCAVALIPVPAGGNAARLPMAPPDALVLEQGAEIVAIVPDPSGPGRRERLTAAIREGEVYVGTVRPPEEIPVSLAHARRIRRLVAEGVVPTAPVVIATDHLLELVVSADEALLGELRERALRPLLAVPEGRRAALEQTLRSWLAHEGDRAAVAADLVVHPQTVSYRVTRLRGLFGPALDDPRTRFALRLVLAA